MVLPARLCLICKGGRNLCGNETCPLLSRIKLIPRIKSKISTEFYGPSTSIFVGRFGYPNVFVGPMAPIDKNHIGIADSPKKWFGMDYSQIVELRSLVLRSKLKQNIFSRSRFIEENQLLALSSKPANVEFKFKKKPVYNFSFSDIVQPVGPSAQLEKIKITENIRIERKVDKIVSNELKAADASYQLYQNKIDVYKISTILSSGALGLEKNKKLVPTRFGITAVDDIITKSLINEIKQSPVVNEFQVYSSGYLHNHFEILFIPGNWEFENFEAWAPGSFWASNLKEPYIIEEHEPFKGRTKYADKQGGGYYASRIACVENLYKMKRQARVVAFREVYEGYILPLGVWVVRETARKAFDNPAKKFNNLKDALDHINSKLRLDISKYINKSRILNQKRLNEFLQ